MSIQGKAGYRQGVRYKAAWQLHWWERRGREGYYRGRIEIDRERDTRQSRCKKVREAKAKA